MNNVLLPGAAPCVTPKLQRFLERLNRSQVKALVQPVPASDSKPAII